MPRPERMMTDTTIFMNDLSCSERLLVWCVRRLSGEGRTGGGMPGLALPCFRADFAAVVEAFHMALGRLRAYQREPVDVGICNATHLTGTESRFLLAAAAAQEGREAEVRRTLRPIFAHHHVLSPFAAAITQLGACMAGAGYWLPRRATTPALPNRPPVTQLRRPSRDAAARPQSPSPTMSQPVGAGCLAAMRWHDADMGSAHVMWPGHALPQAGGL
ncbi:hypothetical protein CFR78_08110 [Komagataeibacter rhaeticus]|uniref:hypothetical protein n=1 Tax=Komagataeibacter rhaeticus TaxID=215221 RepID=UPI0004D349C1|nr:hypothetical protein [Komagataeibacter rhaeticus]KDU94660.1 hypothetical protein GLUCORHAEAF1_13215 [Komagataeibacter rhaeticus AF1]PYD53591.1 hypothetical protein CFR78_08110 [Komagataeibacter rhaeticus]